MTIRKSAAQPISFSVPGDLVRITNTGGAHIAGIGPVSAGFVKGAFGHAVAQPDGSIGIRMHSLMPAEIGALQMINTTDQTQVERISVDDESEVAVLGLQYLQGLAEQIRSRVAGQQNLRPLMMAALQSEGQRISDVLASSNLKVVEFSESKTVTTKKVYVTSDPDSIRDGVIPADAIAFNLAPETTESNSTETFNADRALEVLYSQSTVANTSAPVAVQEDAVPLSPFMRGLIGNSDLTNNDLNLGDILGNGDGFNHDRPGM